MEKNKKFARIDTSCHVSAKCPFKKCEGTALIPITPTQKAKIRAAVNLDLGTVEFSCHHKIQVIATP